MDTQRVKAPSAWVALIHPKYVNVGTPENSDPEAYCRARLVHRVHQLHPLYVSLRQLRFPVQSLK